MRCTLLRPDHVDSLLTWSGLSMPAACSLSLKKARREK